MWCFYLTAALCGASDMTVLMLFQDPLFDLRNSVEHHTWGKPSWLSGLCAGLSLRVCIPSAKDYKTVHLLFSQ